jgi:hypothetical protein
MQLYQATKSLRIIGKIIEICKTAIITAKNLFHSRYQNKIYNNFLLKSANKI